MDFEVKELEAETERERLEKIKKFEPPEVERRQLTPAEIAEVRVKNMEYFHRQQKLKKGRGADGRVEFIPALKFEGRMKGYYFGRGDGGEEQLGHDKNKTKIETQDGQSGMNLGYYIDYAQMRHLMQMDIGDRCEARYKKVRNYFNGMVVGIHDEDCTYDIRFQHGHVELKIPAEHVRKKEWVGKIKEGEGISRSLKAANPIMEKKDVTVEWYEQLLAWEQGKIDVPQAPEGLFKGAAPGARSGDGAPNPMALLEMMSVADGGLTPEADDDDFIGSDDDLPVLSLGLDGLGGGDGETAANDDDKVIEETREEREQRELEEAEEWERQKNSGWRQYKLPPRPATGPAKSAEDDAREAEAATQLALLTVEDVVKSGHIWKTDSDEYKKFWDWDEWPHRPGAPTHRAYYDAQGEPASDDERNATKEKPYLLNGDISVKKWIEREAPRDGPNRRPTAGCLVVCHIIMSRLDGTVCQSSYDEDYQTQKVEPERLRLFCDEDHNGVPRSKKYLQGLHEGLASMRVGELAHFVMVPEKTFGRKGRYPAVPGYSKESPRGTWLRFEVDLLSCELQDEDVTGKELVDPNSFSLLQRPDGYDWNGMDHATMNPFRNEKQCSWCRKPTRLMHGNKKFKRCGRCKTTLYCSTECGKAAWPHHKLVCSKPDDHYVNECEAEYQLLTEGGKTPEAIKAAAEGGAEEAKDGDEEKKEEEAAVEEKEEEKEADTSPMALVKRKTDAIISMVSAKLGDRPPRVCLIAAYRNQLPLQDRQPQLFKFVPYMVAYLGYARPKCEFTVVIATQTDDGRKFNRGRLMNASFRDVVQEAEAEGRPYDSVIFHDIDILPSEDLMPYYTCPPKSKRPVHLGGAWRTKYRNAEFVGGALAFRPEDYVACNGYANDNWGWGLDDEEIALRMVEAGLKIVKPPEAVGSYSDLDPINLYNIVHSEERGYYHEWWNMDMENGKCQPKVSGPIHWELYSQWWRDRGLSDIEGHSELIARTHEFGGRVVRLLYELQNDLERKEGVVALVSARKSLKACLDAKMSGPVADAALAQTRALAAMGNLRTGQARLMHKNKKLLTTEQQYMLQGGRKPREKSSSRGNRRLTSG